MDDLTLRIGNLYKKFFAKEKENAAELVKKLKKRYEEKKNKRLKQKELSRVALGVIELNARRAAEHELREAACRLFGFNEKSFDALSERQKAKAIATVLLHRKTDVRIVADICDLSVAKIKEIDYLRLKSGVGAVKMEEIYRI